MVLQKVPKSYFQSQFSMSKIDGIFSKKKSFFSNFNFEPLHFLKSCPIFDELDLPVFSKNNGFLWVYWFLAKNLAFWLKFHNRTDISLYDMVVARYCTLCQSPDIWTGQNRSPIFWYVVLIRLIGWIGHALLCQPSKGHPCRISILFHNVLHFKKMETYFALLCFWTFV